MNKLKSLFKFGGHLDNKTSVMVSILGAIIIFIAWYLITLNGNIISAKILPKPIDVIVGFKTLICEQGVLKEALYSIKLNLLAYFYALIIALPIGFLIGIYPLCNGLFSKYIDALRFLPIPCISGIFIAVLGLGFNMKASFLAFGILLFLIPAVVNNVKKLQNPTNANDFVYLQTIKTLGATNWQKFIHVYIPYVMGNISDELRNLVSISWTYVVIAEVLNKDGGIGAMINTLFRQSLTPLAYGVLFLIIIIGIGQDILLKKLDNKLFPYKNDR